MRRARFQRARVQGFDLTPMIDVVLQIIIFFMFTSRFGELVRSEIDLPRQMGDDSAMAVEALVLDVTAEGGLLLEGVPVGIGQAADVARARIAVGEASGVRLRCDRAATGATLNRVARSLASAGVDRVSISTSQEGAP